MTTVPAPGLKNRLRWYHAYFLLAVFNVLAVAAGVCLSGVALARHSAAVSSSERWIGFESHVWQLTDSIKAVDSAAAEALASGDALEQQFRLQDSFVSFCRILQSVRDEAEQAVSEPLRAPILEQLARIDDRVVKLEQECEKALYAVEAGRPADAAVQMATMDRSVAASLSDLGGLCGIVKRFESEETARSSRRTRAFAGLHLALGALIVSLAIALSFYLHRVAHRLMPTEEIVAAGAARLRGVLEAAPEGILTIDDKGVIESFNPAAERMFGYAADEVIGRNVTMMMPSPFRENHDSFLARYEADSAERSLVVERETLGRRKNGESFPVEISICEVVIGGRRTFTGFLRDISERKQSQAALLRAQAEMRAVFDASPLGMFLADREGRCVQINSTLERISRKKTAETRNEGWLEAIPRGDRARIAADWRQCVETKAPFECVHRFQHDDKRVVWVTIKAAPAQIDGETFGFVGTVENITDRKQAELDLRRSNEELQATQRRLEDQARRLREAQERAEAASLAKTQFLANMSHEIRTPMTAILGYAEFLVGNGLDPAASNRALETIRRNGNHLLTIINDILDLSKIESGKVGINRVRLSPREQLAQVISLLKLRADEKGVALTSHVEPDVPEFIESDPTRLRQILLNLVGNAIKFTPSGAVTVTTCVEKSEGKTRRLNFEVHDTGVGMNAAQIGQLFRPFSQGDTSSTREYGGTGLGLTISLRLARLLGGDIEVRSAEGQGSTFTASIAIGEAVPATANLADSLPPPPSCAHERMVEKPLAGCSILLAEDGIDNQRLMALILQRAGAEVAVAENGTLAVDQALAARDAGQPFELILMDMQMPVLDGYGATRLLRERGYTGPIVAVTAHAMDSDRTQCLAAGCDDFVSKPIDRAHLVEIAIHFARRSAGRGIVSAPFVGTALTPTARV